MKGYINRYTENTLSITIFKFVNHKKPHLMKNIVCILFFILGLSNVLKSQIPMQGLMPRENWQQRRMDKERELQLQMQMLELAQKEYDRTLQQGKVCEQETKITYANLVSSLSQISNGEHFVQTVTTSQWGISCVKDIVYVENQYIVGAKNAQGQRVEFQKKLSIVLGKAKVTGTMNDSGKQVPYLTEIFFLYEQ